MKITLGLLMLLLLTSCYDSLDDNKRGFFKITTIDETGAALANVDVSVNSGDFFNDFLFSQAKFSDEPERFVLGTGITDAQGEASFLILINSDRNTSIRLTRNDEYETTLFLKDSLYSNSLEYDLSQVELKPKSQVVIEFNNTSGTSAAVFANISLESVNCQQLDGNINPPEFDCQREIWANFNQEFSQDSLEFNAVYPSTLIVEYMEENGSTITEQFLVTGPNESYVISY